jgi:hypothetical protein
LRTALPNWVRLLLIASLIFVIVALIYTNYHYAVLAPGGNDFLSRWMGAKSWLVDGMNPYDPEVSLRSQEAIYGRPAIPEEGEDVAHFVYPFPAMIFFGPFGLLPYNEARAIWMTLLELSLLLLTWIGLNLAKWNPPRIIVAILLVFSVVWYHGFRAVILGQFAVFEALIMAGTLFAIQRKQDWLGGILLALTICKPQMSFLFIPFVLIWGLSNRRWVLVLSAVGSMAAILGLSLVILPGWPLDWLQQVLSYPDYTTTQPPVGIVADLIPGISSWIQLVLTCLFLIYLIWEWILSLRSGDRWFQWTAAMTILVTNLIVIRTATTNYLAMVPGLLLVFSVFVDRWRKGGSIAVGFILFILFIGLWMLFLRTIEGNIENPVMYLPLPIFMLISLWWTRWWCIKPTRLPLETTPLA